MHVFCFFKTPSLSQGFQAYLKKNIPSITVFQNGQEIGCPQPSSFVLLEDPTSEELKIYKDFWGISLETQPSLATHTHNFPHFIFLQKPIYLPLLLKVFLEHAQKSTLSSTLNSSDSFKIGSFIYKRLQRALLDLPQNQSLSLTEKEAAILDFLSSRPNGYATRSELLENIWHFREDISTRTLESHIYTLRQKIEPNPSSPQHLLTKEGGYCLKYEDS